MSAQPVPPLEVVPDDDDGFFGRRNIFALFVGSGMFVMAYLLLAWTQATTSALLFIVLPLVSAYTVGMLAPKRSMVFSSCYYSLLMNMILAPFMLAEGIFCVIMAAPVFALITAFGAVLARGMRDDDEAPRIRRKPPTQFMLPLAAVLCVGSLWDAKVLREGASIEVVRSEIEIAAPRETVWNRLSFQRAPVAQVPLWLRPWIKQPDHYAFANTGLGAVREIDFGPPCYGDDRDALRNKLVYEIVEWNPNESCSFKCRENHSRMRFWVDLIDTRVELVDAGFAATRVIITTRYRRKIGPSIYFTPKRRRRWHAQNAGRRSDRCQSR